MVKIRRKNPGGAAAHRGFLGTVEGSKCLIRSTSTVVLARRPRRSLFLFPAKTMPVMRESSGSGGRFRRAALGVGLAIHSMFGCNGACAESAILRPFVANRSCPPFAPIVAEAAQRFGIPAAWI